MLNSDVTMEKVNGDEMRESLLTETNGRAVTKFFLYIYYWLRILIEHKLVLSYSYLSFSGYKYRVDSKENIFCHLIETE